MASLEFLAPAIRDMERIAENHLKMVGPESSKKITDHILEIIQILEDQPLSGNKHPDIVLQRQGFRKLVCGDYICIYKFIDSKTVIYRVVHGATDYPSSF